jgi:hypothetical protein
MNKKELAKFFSGFAVSKVGFHAAFAVSNVLPFKLIGFTVTPNYNFWITIFWAAVAAFLIHYAWFRK